MRRRDFLAASLVLPLTARAQGRVHVIGLLWNDSVKPSPYTVTLLEALRGRGYVQGKNLRVEDRVALEGYAPMAESAAALARAKPDLIVTYGSTATVAAAKATKDIPIVMVGGADPIALGVAASLSRPAGNVTGIFTLTSETVGKRLELLRELVPGLSRLGHLLGAGAVRTSINRREVSEKARAMGMEVQAAEVRSPEEIEPSIARLAKSRVQAIFMTGSSMLTAHADRVVGAIAQARLPAIYGVDRCIEAGGLIVYAPNANKSLVRAAGYVDRILRGARPAEMPIEQSEDTELVINLKTAKAQGIRIPQSILQRADRAIE